MSALRDIRKLHRLTLEQLARKAGLTKARMWALERRPPKMLQRLCRLADVLGSSLDALAGRIPPEPAPVDTLAAADRQLLDMFERDELDGDGRERSRHQSDV